MDPEADALLAAWLEAAAARRAGDFLRERFGSPRLDVVEEVKGRLDRLSHRQPPQAVERARELVAYADGGADPAARVVARLALANALLWSERLDEADAAYETARRLAEACGLVALAARCGVGRVGVLFRQGRYQEARDLADAIEPVLRRHPETALYAARVQAQRATILQYLGHAEESLRAYEGAARQFRALGPEGALDLAAAQHNAGLLAAQLGRYGEAARLLEEARDAARRAGSPLLAARAEGAEAWVDLAQGRYAPALRRFEEVSRRYAAAGVPAAAAAYRLFALECWLYLGQTDRVAREGPVVARQLESAGLVPEAGRARYLAGVAHRQRGRLELAEGLLQQAHTDLAQVGREGWRAAAACELAAVRLRAADWTGALALVAEAEEAWARLGNPAGAGRALLVRSDALQAAGDLPGAERAARAALRTAQRYHMAWLAAASHRRLSRLRPQRRTPHLVSGVRWADRMLAWVPADLRPGLFAELEDLYTQAVAHLWEQGRAVRAWQVAQSAKSRGMAHLLASHGLRVRPRVPEDAHLVQELNGLLDRYRSRLGDLDPPEAPRLEPPPDLEARVRELLWQLQLRDPAYLQDADLLGRFVRPGLPRLEPDTALVEYFTAGGHVLAFVVEPAGQVWVQRTCPTREVAKAAALWSHGVRAHVAGQLATPQALRQAHRVLSQLYALLLAPVEAALRRFRRLVVAPYGALHGLPFHAFADGDECAWDRWEVSYIPAGSLLPLLQARPRPRGEAVCVADGLGGRLPGVQEEARWVARRVGAVLVQEPGPQEFLRALHGARLAHVAAHCRFRADSPLLSAVHLTGGPVTVADVLASSVSCGVVVLSGCDTAASRVLPGDELVGFARAWFHAGAHALVLSLWPLDDAAACAFMQQFYHAAAQGARLAEALRQAAFHLRAARPHPRDWAAFVLVGDPRTRLSDALHAPGPLPEERSEGG